MERLMKDFIEPLVSQSWVKTGIEAPICFHDELHVSGNGSTNSTKRVPLAINASPARSFLQKGGHLSLTHPAEWFLNIRIHSPSWCANLAVTSLSDKNAHTNFGSEPNTAKPSGCVSQSAPRRLQQCSLQIRTSPCEDLGQQAKKSEKACELRAPHAERSCNISLYFSCNISAVPSIHCWAQWTEPFASGVFTQICNQWLQNF